MRVEAGVRPSERRSLRRKALSAKSKTLIGVRQMLTFNWVDDPCCQSDRLPPTQSGALAKFSLPQQKASPPSAMVFLGLPSIWGIPSHE